MKLEAKVLANMKIWYLDVFFHLTLTLFSGLIHALKASYNNYGGNTDVEYYKMLEICYLYDKCVKKLLEKLE